MERTPIETPGVTPLVIATALRRLSFPARATEDSDGVHAALAGELLGAFAADEVHVTHLAPDRSTGRVVQYLPGNDGQAVAGAA